MGVLRQVGRLLAEISTAADRPHPKPGSAHRRATRFGPLGNACQRSAMVVGVSLGMCSGVMLARMNPYQSITIPYMNET